MTLRRREVLALIIGPLLYAGLSWTTNVFQMEAAADLQIRPGVAVPIIFGFVYGPLVGFVTGAVGNLLVDCLSGGVPYAAAIPAGNPIGDLLRAYLFNWQIGNGLMGLVSGLAAMRYRRYFTLRDQLRALLISVLGILLGMGFAAYADPEVALSAVFDYSFLPAAKVNLLNAVIIVPIVLYNYERFDVRSTEWMRSGLMKRLLIAILMSAALPTALLSLFLTQQQMTEATADSTQLLGKLGFTVLLSLLFTVVNSGMVAQSISRPLLRLTEAAKLMETGQLDRNRAIELDAIDNKDEIRQLSHVFGHMALEVMGREEALRTEVAQLRIEINESKKAHEVAEITGSDYFRDLQVKARRMREKNSQ